MEKHTRRQFLKLAAAGVAGTLFIPHRGFAFLPASSSAGWRSGLNINPTISNVKAICCYDEAMIDIKLANDFARQNENVNATAIAKNMDELASKLANINTPSQAWQAIFRKPSAKQWNQVKAAIKVDCANPANMPRIAIVGKICTELINLGVSPGNITLYDTRYNAAGTGKYADSQGNPISGLPSGIVVSSQINDGPEVPVGGDIMKCSPVIAASNAGTISYIPDILVNIATNQGADAAGTEPGLCMSNHTGTLKFSTPSAAELIAMNQCEAVIGQGTTAIPCRQQLCIIDSLWATTGNTGNFSAVPCRIVMGTLPPVMDYLTAKNIREPQRIMNVPPNGSLITSWLTAFGYVATDCMWYEYSPSTPVSDIHHPNNQRGTDLRVSLCNGAGAQFKLPHSNLPIAIDIFSLQGRRLRRLSLPPSADPSITISLPVAGYFSSPAGYAIRCRMGGEEKTEIARPFY
jgi:hypothetical protein